MRVALLVVALLALASCASAQRYVQIATFDEFGATDSNFMCVGNATYYNLTIGTCTNGAATYCDGSYVYSFTFRQSDNTVDPLCMPGNITSGSRFPVGCGSNGSGYRSYTCMNTTQDPAVPSTPSTFSAWARSANFNFTNTPNDNQKVTTGYKQDCSQSTYYQESGAVVPPACSALTSIYKGYSSQAVGCDGTYNYGYVYDNTVCTGNVVRVQATPCKAKASECNKNTGVNTAAVTCPNTLTPVTPAYQTASGAQYAIYTTYNDKDCATANFTQSVAYSNKCAGNVKYICSGSGNATVLTEVDYTGVTVLCDGVNNSNQSLTLGCVNGLSTSSKWQCLTGTIPGQPGAASSISVSFVTLMIAAFVAMVARQ